MFGYDRPIAIPDPIDFTNASSPDAVKLEYDQVLSGDVKIKKKCNSDDEYKIIFSKKDISNILMYQIFSSTSAALNGNRKVIEIKAKYWVKNAFPYPQPEFPFTPTCVMKLCHSECPIHHKGKCCINNVCRHVFVINNAKVNNCGQVIFYVSSEDIDKNSTNKMIQKLKKIPQGSFHNVRFDIDPVNNSVFCTYCKKHECPPYEPKVDFCMNSFCPSCLSRPFL